MSSSGFAFRVMFKKLDREKEEETVVSEFRNYNRKIRDEVTRRLPVKMDKIVEDRNGDFLLEDFSKDKIEKAREYLIEAVRRENRRFAEITRSYVVSQHNYWKSYVTNTFTPATTIGYSQKHKSAVSSNVLTNNSNAQQQKITTNTNPSKHKIEETDFKLTFSIKKIPELQQFIEIALGIAAGVLSYDKKTRGEELIYDVTFGHAQLATFFEFKIRNWIFKDKPYTLEDIQFEDPKEEKVKVIIKKIKKSL